MGSNQREICKLNSRQKTCEKGPDLAHQIELIGSSEVSNELPDDFCITYTDIIEQDKNCWVVVGDETGDLGEFMGKKPRKPSSSMGWVVIPPKSNLPPLPSFFHVHQ